MLTLINKHALITATLVASLGLTACGSKKDVYDKPRPTTSKAEGKESDTEVSDEAKAEESDTNGKLGGGLGEGQADETELPPLPAPPPEDAKPSKTKVEPKQTTIDTSKEDNQGLEAPPAPVVKPETKKADKAPAKKETPKAESTKAPAVSKTKESSSKDSKKESSKAKPAPAVKETAGGRSCQGPTPSVLAADDMEKSIPSRYDSSDVSNLENDSLSKRFTGGIYGDGLYYTSSSTDDLLSFLRARNERASYENRQANLAAAHAVQSAQMSIESMSNDAVVTLKIKEDGKVKVYNLAGALQENYAGKLVSVRSGNGTTSTGTRDISATAKCLDLDGGCETTLIRVEIGEQNCSGIFYVVFRKSVSDLYFNFAKNSGKSDSREFLILRDLFFNTILNKKHTDEKIEVATMNSWEVVNGRSGVVMSMKGLNNELIAFSAPLVAPEAGTGVNLPAGRIANDADESLDLLANGQYSLNYANTIGDARLVANNGLGQVRIMIKMRKRANLPQDKVAITFMRRIKPLVDINDDNLK
jgi:Periplasmic protein TonB, links inner and outer membranes